MVDGNTELNKGKSDGNTSTTVNKSSGNVKKKKKSAGRFALEFFIKIIITALVVVLLLMYVAGVYINHSNSGYPMIKDGDLCLTYKLGKFQENDEIAYIYDDKIRFGRVVGFPGDVIDISEGQLTVNGYGAYEATVYPTTSEGSKISYPYSVPSDTVFVLNDYRDDVNDSRCFGGIPQKDTKGKVVMLLRRRGF